MHLYNELRKLMPERMERSASAPSPDLDDESDRLSVEVNPGLLQDCGSIPVLLNHLCTTVPIPPVMAYPSAI